MADLETHQELPKSVDEAIDRLLNDLSEDDKEYLRGVSDPSELHFSLGLQIRRAIICLMDDEIEAQDC